MHLPSPHPPSPPTEGRIPRHRPAAHGLGAGGGGRALGKGPPSRKANARLGVYWEKGLFLSKRGQGLQGMPSAADGGEEGTVSFTAPEATRSRGFGRAAMMQGAQPLPGAGAQHALAPCKASVLLHVLCPGPGSSCRASFNFLGKTRQVFLSQPVPRG